MKKGFLVLGVGIAILYFAVLKASRSLTYAIGKIEGLNIKGGSLSWIQNITVVNGDITPIPITSINVRNSINGTELGSSYLLEPTILNGRTSNNLKIKIVIPYFDLLSLGLGNLQNKSFLIRFNGSLNSSIISIPIDQTFTLNIPKF